MKKHIVTRALHALLGLAVIHQLIISNVMQAPLNGKTENFAFEVHEAIGLTTLGVVALFWSWVLIRNVDTSIGSLIPWFSSKRRVEVVNDIKSLARSLAKLDLSGIPVESALASAIHGLGLLTVMAAAVSGAGWLLFEESNKVIADSLIEAHEMVTTFVWAYLIGHAGLAVIHEFSGHALLRRMFPFGRRFDR